MSRERILRAVRAALEAREPVAHPGAFGSWREAGETLPAEAEPVGAFQAAFEAAGGEVVRASGTDEVSAALRALLADADGVAVGAGVPEGLLPDRPTLEPRDAPVGVSMARGAVAETGSLLMDARDGRRVQLLPPVHLVLVRAQDVHATLAQALAALAGDLPSGLGLHSGPSKSADIGQVLVQGVHGPGRVVAVVATGWEARPEPTP